MDALTKALDNSLALTNTARSQATQMKQAGGLDLSSDGGGQLFDQFRSKSAQNEKYALFRGWVYSAIHALSCEAAGQPVELGRLTGMEDSDSKGRRNLGPSRNKMPQWVKTKSARQELEILRRHPVLDSLDHPIGFQSRWQFVYSFVANLYLTGWSYVVVGKKSDDGFEFASIPTTWVTPNHDKGAFSSIIVNNPKKPGGKGEVYKRGQFGVASFPNPSDPIGAMAPSQAQIMSLRVDDHIQTSQERFFENGTFPSVVITVGQNPLGVTGAKGSRPLLTPPQHRQITSAIQRRWAGVANYGNPAVIDGLIERIDKFFVGSQEMGWQKSEEVIRDRIVCAYGVNPFILGKVMNVGGYSQATVIKEIFCTRVNTVLDMLSSLMTMVVTEFTEDPDLLVWWHKCEAKDPQIELEKWKQGRNNGDVSKNEYRTEVLGIEADETPNEIQVDPKLVGSIVTLLSNAPRMGIGPQQVSAFLELLGVTPDFALRIAQNPVNVELEGEEQRLLQEGITSLSAAMKTLRETAA